MPATKYDTHNGAKPRYDNGGTEFGLMHRDLGPGYLMLDIDRIYVELTIEMSIKREDECFIEHRVSRENGRLSSVKYTAMFELKAKKTEYAMAALDPDVSNSFVRQDIADKLGCRLFVVFATNKRQPFEFHEYIDGQYVEVGTLDYKNGDAEGRKKAVKEFWENVLHIQL